MNVFTHVKYEAGHENKLMLDLRRKYADIGTDSRPVFNTSETVRISLGLALIYIDRIEAVPDGSADAEITVSAWMRYVSDQMTIFTFSQHRNYID